MPPRLPTLSGGLLRLTAQTRASLSASFLFFHAMIPETQIVSGKHSLGLALGEEEAKKTKKKTILPANS